MLKILPYAAVAALALGLARPVPPDARAGELARFLPARAAVHAESNGLADLCRQGLEHPLLATLADSPLGELLEREAGITPAGGLAMLDLWARRPVLPTLARLTAEGVALGVVPVDGEKPAVCLVARGEATLWSDVIEEALERIAEERDLPADRIVPPHARVRGMDVWRLGERFAMAHADGLFLAASGEDLLREMIDLAATADGGLAAREDFAAARARSDPAGAFLWSWIDLERLEDSADDGLAELRAIPRQPAAQLLLGPGVANLGAARAAVLDLRLDGARVALDVLGIGVPEGAAAKLLAPADSSPAALPARRADEAARATVYRDLATLFRERVDLFPVEVQPGFAEAVANLALFFGGQDVTDEVLPGIAPWIGVIARPVDFDPRAVPAVPLPGAAVLLRVREPETMGPQLVAAVQSVLSVLNVEAAQKMQPVMTVQLEMHAGATITYGRFRTPAEGEGVDLRYNLEPACAMVGDTFVLGTHRALVRDLVGQLRAGDLEAPGRGEALRISGAQVAELVRANEDALVLNAVLTEGKPEAQARTEVRGLALAAELFEALELETARVAAHDLRVGLRLLLAGEAR